MRISYYVGNSFNGDPTKTHAEAYCRFYDWLEEFALANFKTTISETFSDGVSIQLVRGHKRNEYYVTEHNRNSAEVYRFNNRMWAEQRYHSAINVQLIMESRNHASSKPL